MVRDINQNNQGETMSEGGVNFNKDVGTANVNAGEGQMNTGSGEMNVADNIDASQGKVDNTGATIESQENTSTNIKGGGEVSLMEHVTPVFEEMTKAADEMGIPPYEPPVEARAIPGEETEASDTPVFEEFDTFEPMEITDNSDHPEAVYSSMQSYAAAPNPPTVEEQKNFFSRAYSCVHKYATSDTAKGLAETAAGAIEVVAGGLPFPANLTVFLLKKVANK